MCKNIIKNKKFLKIRKKNLIVNYSIFLIKDIGYTKFVTVLQLFKYPL